MSHDLNSKMMLDETAIMNHKNARSHEKNNEVKQAGSALIIQEAEGKSHVDATENETKNYKKSSKIKQADQANLPKNFENDEQDGETDEEMVHENAS